MVLMMELEEALKVFDGVKEIDDTESVKINDSIGRIIAHDTVSKYDFPPYDRSAMDGFAFRYEDIAASPTPLLKVKGEVMAGHSGKIDLNKGECVRIMTGGVVPKPCDTVIEFEACTEEGGIVRIPKLPPKFSNIAFQGEDLKKGEYAFERGDLVKENKINLMASLGMNYVDVKRKLRIGVIPTGDELIDIDEELNYGKIRDSSKYSLEAQIRGVFQEFVNFGISKDDEESIKYKISKGIESECDILLITGGSSMGDKDLTQRVLEKMGATIIAEKIAIKPGMPTIIAKLNGRKDVWIFGMPGNPVSTYIAFEMVVIPLIEKLTGTNKLSPNLLEGTFAGTFKKKPDRVHFVPCKVESGKVIPIRYNGSGDFTSLSRADGFFIAPKESSVLQTGDPVKYFMIKG
uniref:Molybdopterin molybdenumtransferase n=1 Tax=Mesoaciditoga lauensis TaxID=1495039 RepID=A0A7V3RF57_9BACT